VISIGAKINKVSPYAAPNSDNWLKGKSSGVHCQKFALRNRKGMDNMRSAFVVSASTRAAVAAALLSAAIISNGPATATDPWPSTAAETRQLIYSPWTKFCGKASGPSAKEVCFTGKDARTEAGQPIIAAALIEPEGDPKKLFRVTLPSSLQLQFGSRLIIDKEPPISGAFFTCFANGCMADYEATLELVGKLKKGQMLQIQAINPSAAIITFLLPLADSSGNSFAGANEGPPTDPKVFEEQKEATGPLRGDFDFLLRRLPFAPECKQGP
jgi:invasion protein IalB